MRMVSVASPEEWDFCAMKIVLIIIAMLVVAGSIWADYRWRKWMADRKRDRQ